MSIVLPVSLVALAGLPLVYYFRRGRSRAAFRPELYVGNVDKIVFPENPKLSADTYLEEGPSVDDNPVNLRRRTQFFKRDIPSRPTTLLTALSDPGLIMQMVLSLIVIGAGLFMILSKRYDASNEHWAYGTVGTVVGFWLKGAK